MLAILSLVLTAVLWSTSGLFIKLLDMPPIIIAGTRSFFAVFSILVIKVTAGRVTAGRVIEGRGGFKAFFGLFSVSIRERAFWFSAIAYSATMLLFVAANKWTYAANAILLQYSAPVWTAFLGWILIKEKPRIEHWICMFFVFIGMFIFFKNSFGGGFFLGDILAIASGITFGANAVFMRMQKNGDSACSMLFANIITALFAAPFLFWTPLSLNKITFAAIFFMGVFQIGLASVLFSFALKRIRALESMLIVALEPILSPLWVFIGTGEKPSVNALFGGGVIVAAVVAANIASRRKAAI